MSTRQQRRGAKRFALETRIRSWTWHLRRNPDQPAVILGCHTITRDQLIAGKNIPGVPKDR